MPVPTRTDSSLAPGPSPDLASLCLLVGTLPGFYLLLSADPEFRVLAASAEQLAWARLPRDDVVGRPFFELVTDPPGSLAEHGTLALRESLSKVCDTGARDDLLELRCGIQGPDDVDANLLWRSVNLPVPGGNGKPAYILHSVEDIRQQRANEQALRDLNETLEARVAEHNRDRALTWRVTPDLLGVANRDGFFESTNPAWQKFVGWPAERLRATRLIDLVHPDDVESTLSQFEILGRGVSVLRFENRFKIHDGSYRWLSWTAVPEDSRFYCSARDITMDKERQLELIRTQEALRQSQKMEAVGQLTGGIAHDFNNLLAGILGSLDLMQRRIDRRQFDGLDRYVQMARSSSQRAAALTHRLLAFSRRQALVPKPISLNGVVAGMEEILRRTLGENIVLKSCLAPNLWLAYTDINQFENSLLNLVINARDAMPGGGMLTIETANTRLDESYAGRHDDIKPGEYVEISVSDNGCGMSPNIVARAFDPFFTTKPIGQGTGLGLSMIYGYAKQSEGHVTIYSEEGRGTTIKLYLPRHVGRDDAPAQSVQPLPRGHGETVLVVEDEAQVRLIITEVVDELGYTALEASDAESAMRAIDGADRLDLLITDIGLPGTNGRDLAAMARARQPGLKVLFITGYAGEAAVRAGMLTPDMEMMSKPFAIDALALKVRSMLGRN